MKKIFTYGLLFFSIITIAQTQTATTADGKKIILNENKTWEYSTTENNINTFEEPKLDSKMQKKVDKVKRQISLDQNCPIDNIKFVDGVDNGIYVGATFVFIVCEKRMVYKRMGSV